MLSPDDPRIADRSNWKWLSWSAATSSMHHSRANVTNIHDVVQDVPIRSKLLHGFFHPGEERSDSVQVEQDQNWIVHGDLEFSEDTIPDSKYLDYWSKIFAGNVTHHWKRTLLDDDVWWLQNCEALESLIFRSNTVEIFDEWQFMLCMRTILRSSNTKVTTLTRVSVTKWRTRQEAQTKRKQSQTKGDFSFVSIIEK